MTGDDKHRAQRSAPRHAPEEDAGRFDYANLPTGSLQKCKRRPPPSGDKAAGGAIRVELDRFLDLSLADPTPQAA